MEKRTPHCSLEIVFALIRERKVRSTLRAVDDAKLLGLDRDAMIGVLLTLSHRDFYKSMTTYANNRIWQDVYRPNTHLGPLYIKLTVIEDVLIVSFKER